MKLLDTSSYQLAQKMGVVSGAMEALRHAVLEQARTYAAWDKAVEGARVARLTADRETAELRALVEETNPRDPTVLQTVHEPRAVRVRDEEPSLEKR